MEENILPSCPSTAAHRRNRVLGFNLPVGIEQAIGDAAFRDSLTSLMPSGLIPLSGSHFLMGGDQGTSGSGADGETRGDVDRSTRFLGVFDVVDDAAHGGSAKFLVNDGGCGDLG